MHTFLVYFSIPDGAIWSNVLAEPICAVLAIGFVFIFRDRIGKQLAAWWHKHHAVHEPDVDGMERRLMARMDEHHEELKARIGGGGTG